MPKTNNKNNKYIGQYRSQVTQNNIALFNAKYKFKKSFINTQLLQLF